MTDFPELDDDFGGSAPSGDWRSRERDVLGDEFGSEPLRDGSTAHDFDSSGSAFPDLDHGSAPLTSSAPVQQPARNDFVSSFERDAPVVPQHDDGHDDLAAFETQFPVVETSQQPPAQANGYHATSTQPTHLPKQLSMSQTAEPDSEAIRQWREKRNTELAHRDEASKKKQQEIVERAEKVIDDFYQDYNAKKERQIAKNKEEEAAFEQKRTDALAKGTTWERIAELVELSDSRSKTTSRSGRDLSRFKEALLALKREGDTAPGAAGF